MKIRQILKTITGSMGVGLFLMGCAEAETDLDKYKDDYPGCVTIVKNQLALFGPEQQIAVMPALMNACMSGRQIGEKRTKQMYDIPKETKPKKQSNFKVNVTPPSGLKQDSFEVQY
ncbi:MAG: hypothetical protein HWE30_13680 [Methylocystaceae bacterium]|nr:hypothetical protein [Methylocystaceae bacterium]